MASLLEGALLEDGEDEIMAQAAEDAEHQVHYQMQLGGNPGSSQPGRLRFVAEPLHERQSRRFGVHKRVVRLHPIQEGKLIPTDRLADALAQGLRGAVEGVLDRHQVSDADHFYVSLASDRLRSTSNVFFVTGREWRKHGLCAEALLDNLQKMLNSIENFELDDSLQLNVVHVHPQPRGSGPKTKRKKEYHVSGHLSNVKLREVKKSLIKIRRNALGWCAARAIVTVRELHLAGRDPYLRKQWICNRRNLHRRQWTAERLMAEVGLGLGAWGPDELTRVATVPSLREYKIVVLDAHCTYLPMVYGHGPRTLGMVYDDHHYDALGSIKGFLWKKFFCPVCYRGYDNPGRHHCPGNRAMHCSSCNQNTCEEYRQAFKEYRSPTLECSDCRRSFFGPGCVANHKTRTIGGQAVDPKHRPVCETRQKCATCQVYLPKPQDIRKHKCGYAECHSCKECGDIEMHQCFVQVASLEDPDDDHVLPIHVFFDIEAKQGTTKHIPNLLVCQRSDEDRF